MQEKDTENSELSTLQFITFICGEGNGNPLQYTFPENPTDRSLVGYSPCGCQEAGTTEAT